MSDDNVRRSIGDRTLTEAKEIVYDIHTGLSPHRDGIARVLSDLIDQHYADVDLTYDLKRAQADLDESESRSSDYVGIAKAEVEKLVTILANIAVDVEDDNLDWDEMVRGIAEQLADVVTELREIG